MNDFVLLIFPSILIVAVLFIPTFPVIKYYELKNRKKKSPLNINLLRSPGQTLQEEIYELTSKLLENIVTSLLIPALLSSHLLMVFAVLKHNPSILFIIIYALLTAASIIYFSVKNLRLLRKRNRLHLAYECEVAVGQDLQNSLVKGFKIYHDFPANNFNIDHIAIGPSGIFAIETKGRAKSSKSENNNWKVTFDGQTLVFPDWQEQKPIAQSKRQASWLEEWIKNATTEKVKVTPVLALPGWFIERKGNSDVLIYNGKKSNFLEKRQGILSDKQIQTISFQIEKECRNVKKKSYKKLYNE